MNKTDKELVSALRVLAMLESTGSTATIVQRQAADRIERLNGLLEAEQESLRIATDESRLAW